MTTLEQPIGGAHNVNDDTKALQARTERYLGKLAENLGGGDVYARVSALRGGSLVLTEYQGLHFEGEVTVEPTLVPKLVEFLRTHFPEALT